MSTVITFAHRLRYLFGWKVYFELSPFDKRSASDMACTSGLGSTSCSVGGAQTQRLLVPLRTVSLSALIHVHSATGTSSGTARVAARCWPQAGITRCCGYGVQRSARKCLALEVSGLTAVLGDGLLHAIRRRTFARLLRFRRMQSCSHDHLQERQCLVLDLCA